MVSFLKKTAFLFSCSLLLVAYVSSFKVYATEDSILRLDVSKNSEIDSVFASLYGKSDGYELIISGSGEMRDFNSSDFEALIDYCDEILCVKVTEGVTRVGANAFSLFYSLGEIYFENSSIALRWHEDLIPSSAKIFAHYNSSAFSYSAAFDRVFLAICHFNGGKCEICEYECITHEGGIPGCKEKAICEICGLSYGELLEHEFGEFKSEIPPTCESDGRVGYYECEGCGSFFNESKEPIESLIVRTNGHTYGEWVDFISPSCETSGRLGHYHCAVCNKYFNGQKEEILNIAIKETGHSGGEATCQSKAICEVCNKPYGELNPENHSFSGALSYDSEFHYLSCPCGAVADKAAHSYTESVIREATENEEGIIEYKCECGHAYRETVEKLQQAAPDNETNSKANRIKILSVILIVLTSFAAAISSVFLILGFLKNKK